LRGGRRSKRKVKRVCSLRNTHQVAHVGKKGGLHKRKENLFDDIDRAESAWNHYHEDLKNKKGGVFKRKKKKRGLKLTAGARLVSEGARILLELLTEDEGDRKVKNRLQIEGVKEGTVRE